MGVNRLPKTVTRQRRDCDLNPGPSAPESSTITARLPSHHFLTNKTNKRIWTYHHSQGYTNRDRYAATTCTPGENSYIYDDMSVGRVARYSVGYGALNPQVDRPLWMQPISVTQTDSFCVDICRICPFRIDLDKLYCVVVRCKCQSISDNTENLCEMSAWWWCKGRAVRLQLLRKNFSHGHLDQTFKTKMT